MNHRSSLVGRLGRYFLIFLASRSILPCPATAGTALYRCDDGGRIEFRQTACERGDESVTVVTDGSKGMTPSEPGLRLKKPSEKTDTVVHTEKAREVAEKRCWRKRMQLERVERKLRAGYKPSQYQRLHERQDAFTDYIRRFCR